MIKNLISLFLFTCASLGSETFSLSLSKPQLYLGESTVITLTLHYDPAHPPRKIQFKGLHLIQSDTQALPVQKELNKGLIHYPYLITPLRGGSITLPSQTIALSHKDPRTYRNIWKNLQSNTITLDILPLPKGIKIVGNYTLSSHIDTQKIQADKPIHLTLTLKGQGNLAMMPARSLPKNDLLIFTSTPTIEVNQTIQGYLSRWQQRFTILAQKDYTLPPLTIRYFNSDIQLIETLTTPSYHITVDNPKKREALYIKVGLWILGIFIGIIIGLWIAQRRKNRKKQQGPLAISIRKAKSNKALYALLLPYAEEPSLRPFLEKLEKNLYHEEKHKIDKEALIELLP